MIAQRADRINKQAKGTSIYGVIDWIALLPTLLSLIGLCKKPVTPAPVNPTPNPSPVQAQAWADAWHMKATAVETWDGSDYAPATLRRTANQIRKQKRRDGKPITKDESFAAARLALDNARTDTMANLYGDVLEARHAT